MKKLIAILLSITLLFGCIAIPVSAELGDSDNSININEAKSLFERIADVFHDLVAKLFKVFGLDCPLCENHDGYGEAEGDAEFNIAEIAKMYNEEVNELKAHKKTLTIEHISNIRKAELSGTTLSLQKAINAFLEDVLGKNEQTHTFKNNESAKISAILPPEGREAQLSGAYATSASFYKEGDDTIIRFSLMDSKSTFDGVTTTAPEGYTEAFEPINLGGYEFETFEIIFAEISYSATEAEAVVNFNGKLKELRTSTTITIEATVEANGTKTPVTLVLDCADEYQIKY